MCREKGFGFSLGHFKRHNFCFEHLVEKAFDLPMTNRSNLSISARIYDPLGLLSNKNCSDKNVISNYLSR